MKFNKCCLMGLIAAVAMLGTSNVSAVPPPPPQGVVLAPNMVWCPRCGGWGRVPSGFLGWKDKRCPECKGAGMMHPRGYVAPRPVVAPPPPPPKHHHHEARPMPPPPPPRRDVRPVPPPPPPRRDVRPMPPAPQKGDHHRGPGAR